MPSCTLWTNVKLKSEVPRSMSIAKKLSPMDRLGRGEKRLEFEGDRIAHNSRCAQERRKRLTIRSCCGNITNMIIIVII